MLRAYTKGVKKSRLEFSPWVWAAFVLLGNLVAFLAYILVRVPRSAPAEAAL